MTRAECEPGGWNAARPCPFVGCRHSLYLDVRESGSIQYNFPDMDPESMTESCALDVADQGPSLLEKVGDLLNITRERVRQMEKKALKRLITDPKKLSILREFYER